MIRREPLSGGGSSGPLEAPDYFLGGEGALQPGDAAVALIIIGSDQRYLMQLRDQKRGIFYPGHWGLFGGAAEPGEPAERTLRRELHEELGLRVTTARLFTELSFDFGFAGFGRCTRQVYEVPIDPEAIHDLVLREGSAMRLFSAQELLTGPRVVPFDAFSVWLHAAGRKVIRPDPC